MFNLYLQIKIIYICTYAMSRLSKKKSQKPTYLKNVFNVRYKGNVNFAPGV